VAVDPGYVCHYSSAEAVIKIMESRLFLVKFYAGQKDPLECTQWPLMMAENETKWVREMVPDLLSAFHGGAFLLSLCAPVDDTAHGRRRGWNNPLLWRRYASNGTGACLMFNGELLRQRFATLPVVQGTFGWIKYVPGGFPASHASRYPLSRAGQLRAALERPRSKHDGPEVERLRDELHQGCYEVPSGSGLREKTRDLPDESLCDLALMDELTRFMQRAMNESFFLKDVAFAAEDEYRFSGVVTAFTPMQPVDDRVPLEYGDALEGIVLGPQIVPADQERIVGLCKDRGLDCGKAYRVDGEGFELVMLGAV
jgi:hypothetical protein